MADSTPPSTESPRTECPVFGQMCNKCHKKGHFSCQTKVPQVEGIQQSSSSESCLNVETVSLLQTKARQWFTDVCFFKSADDDFTTTLACQEPPVMSFA